MLSVRRASEVGRKNQEIREVDFIIHDLTDPLEGDHPCVFRVHALSELLDEMQKEVGYDEAAKARMLRYALAVRGYWEQQQKR